MLGILARLAAGTTNYSNSGRGGVSVLSSAEVAGLLKGLSQAEINYALAKYCGDDQAFKSFQIHLMCEAAGYAARNDWKTVKGKPRVMSLGALAAIESINPLLCFSCHSPNMLGDKPCSCAKPRVKMTQADKYCYIGVGNTAWSNPWKLRYEQLFYYCQLMDAEVGRVVFLNAKEGVYC